MKKILLVLAFLVGSVASAAATCTSPAVMHDFPGTAFNMSLATNAGDGNCISNVGLIGTLPAYASPPTFNLGTLNGAGTAANQATIITSLGTLHSDNVSILAGVTGPIPAGTATIGTVGQLPYPVGAVPITASATGTTAATTATLAGTAGKTTYICGYSIRANATAATTVTDTITGVITATMSSVLWVAPAASGLGVDEQIFSPCIPASATNTGIAIVSGAPGTGGTVSSKGWGYQL